MKCIDEKTIISIYMYIGLYMWRELSVRKRMSRGRRRKRKEGRRVNEEEEEGEGEKQEGRRRGKANEAYTCSIQMGIMIGYIWKEEEEDE